MKQNESPKNRTIAYLRVSTAEQDLEKNKYDILKFANELKLGQVEFIEEKVSGKVHWLKRKISIINELNKDDVVIVSELSRIGRSMLEIMEILSIATKRQIKIYSVKGNWRLDSSIQSKVVAMAFSLAAEIERDLISSRTKEALASKRLSGVRLGRPKGVGKSKLDQHTTEIEALLANGSTQKFIANRYGTTEANLSNWIKKHKAKE